VKVHPGVSAIPPSVRAPFADGVAPSTLERRTAVLVIGAAALVLLVVLGITPANSPTYDDAKYVGIGRNLLDGNGPVNVFGTLFLKHAPVWPVLIVFPERILGIHPIVVGHVLNAVSGAAILLMLGALGWRIRPALGALGAVTLLGLPYFVEVARTAGIDLPSIAITLGYILLGFIAVRRNSILLAALAGLLFGLGFLIKETILPFAPVPFLAAIVWNVRWPWILRLAAATLAAAALSSSWWLAMYASYTGDVYRVGFPAWTLGPAAIAISIFVLVGLAADPIARRMATWEWRASVASRVPLAARTHGRSIAGWTLAITWVLVLLWVFNRTPKLQGAGLFNPDQIRSYLSGLFGPVSPVFALGLGWILAVAALLRDPAAIGQEARSLLLAVLCGMPLVALVVAVGEAPRHYVGEMALLGLAGWVGWIDGAYHAVVRRDRVLIVLGVALGAAAIAVVGVGALRHVGRIWLFAGAAGVLIAAVVGSLVAIWFRRRGRLLSAGPAAVLATLLLLAGSAAFVSSGGSRSATMTTVENDASARVNAWIRDNVSPGSVIGIGPYLSMTTAMDLPPGYRAVIIRHFLAIEDPTAPLGLRAGERAAADWIAVDVAPNKANQFLVYEAHQVNSLVEENHPAVYVYNLKRERSALSILGALSPKNGFDEVASWSYPVGFDTIETHIFQIDQEHFGIDPHEMFISPKALDRLAGMLEREPDAGRRAAASLLPRIVRPADGSLDAGLARLEALAAPEG
jgi:4-amino-4-deoxy-L-arabinose transferase-like glycosyltransferase